MNTNRTKDKNSARIVGALFIIAMVTSILGGGLLESVIAVPDYLAQLSASTSLIQMGVLMEFSNGIAVVGIAAFMFPILKRYYEGLAIGYVGFRIIEAVFFIAGAIIPLLLLALSRDLVSAGGTDPSHLNAMGDLLVAARALVAGLLIPTFFVLGALLFYYMLYQSLLVPRFISVWGLIGIALIAVLNLIEVSLVVGMVLALPIILNEIFLGIWLIAKGFSPSDRVVRPD